MAEASRPPVERSLGSAEVAPTAVSADGRDASGDVPDASTVLADASIDVPDASAGSEA